MLACLDELPSTAPLPTLRTRMANERALGISFIYAAQTRAQLVAIFGETEARALIGLTNVLVMFGGSKDVHFNREISDLVGTVRVARTTWQTGARRPLHLRGRHPHPAPRRDPATPRTPSPRRRREHPTHHRQTQPLHRRQTRTAPPRPTERRPASPRHPPRRPSARPGTRTRRPRPSRTTRTHRRPNMNRPLGPVTKVV